LQNGVKAEELLVHKNVNGRNIIEEFCIVYALDGTWVTFYTKGCAKAAKRNPGMLEQGKRLSCEKTT
jgi:hypothetical protein